MSFKLETIHRDVTAWLAAALTSQPHYSPHSAAQTIHGKRI